MKDLDEVVLEALDLHASYKLPSLNLRATESRLVIASGNALPTGRVIFHDEPAIFANETEYTHILNLYPNISAATVISASGEKHAPLIISDLIARGIDTSLITCRSKSSAAQLLDGSRIIVTRENPEPITYNTSTYLGMILAKTREDPKAIKDFIDHHVAPILLDFGGFNAFYIMLPAKYDIIREMFVTKFDELFGPRINGRCYTVEQTKHAKTVVPWDAELFISIGCENKDFGLQRLDIPVPKDAAFATLICIGYYVIGRIQRAFPPWFKENAERYRSFQDALFARRHAD